MWKREREKGVCLFGIKGFPQRHGDIAKNKKPFLAVEFGKKGGNYEEEKLQRCEMHEADGQKM